MTGWGPVSLEHAHTTLWGALAGNGKGFYHLRWAQQGVWRNHWLPVTDRRKFGLARGVGEDAETELFLVPRAKAETRFAGQGSVLWVRVEGVKQMNALLAFRPAPTIIVREGASSRATAVWALGKPLGPDWVLRGSERLAHCLGAARKWCDPDSATLNVPGSCLRDGRVRPVPVVVESCTDMLYSARDVVGRLKEAPDRDAWRERMAA